MREVCRRSRLMRRAIPMFEQNRERGKRSVKMCAERSFMLLVPLLADAR